MAIGTLAAIGLAVGAVGSVVSSGNARSASNNASNIAAQTARDNNATALNIYGQNQAALSPFMARGNAAGSALNALYGLGGTPDIPATPATPGYGGGLGGFGSGFGGVTGGLPPGSPAYGWFGNGRGSVPGGGPGSGYNIPATPGTPAIPGQTSQAAASAAFDQFRNSTGYQFRLGEGNRGVNSAYAGAGTVKSGDAMRAIADYNQNFASNEFGNYVGGLNNQQGVGLAGASALAGVGQNYANSVQANNNSAGTAAANAALSRGQNSFGNTLGMIGGGMFGYSQNRGF